MSEPKIPKGYKKTEVGVIPEEWDVELLGNIFEVAGGYPASRAQLSDAGNLYLHYGDIHLSTASYLNTKDSNDSIPRLNIQMSQVGDKSVLGTGDVVFVDASEDDLGACKHIVIENPENLPFISGLHTIVLKDRANTFYLGYKRHCFKTQNIRKQIKYYAVGTKVVGISKENLKKLLIPLPPLPEQRAIAEALSDVDSLLSSLDKLIEKKRAIKQGAMQELLTGRKRLPGFSGKWEQKKLGEICTIQTGKKDVNEGNPNGLYPFFSCSRDISYSEYYSFDCEAILIAGNGDVGNLHFYNGKFEAYQRTYVLSIFNLHIQYVWYQLVAFLADELGVGSIGSSIPYIKMENLVDFEFIVPLEIKEQTAIATILSDMDADIEALERRRDKTKATKQGMMQELLTGRIRLV